MSRNQLAAARKYGERYWLYVIEDLDGQPKLHAIQHPEGQVTYYVFDGSWHGNASYSEELTL
ncbi:protein NO VEIN domain-containing protein [Deinococcus radiophilus]|uniref:protein NO VEIN domain-containing protein n=1 Tax=Deinococcus radiophilus TaxID=32062 RepID=UPI00360EB07F